MDHRFPLGVVRHGQALPLHARVEHPQDDEVEDPMNWLRVFRSADASRMGEGHRQQGYMQSVRSDKGGALRGTTEARMRLSPRPQGHL